MGRFLAGFQSDGIREITELLQVGRHDRRGVLVAIQSVEPALELLGLEVRILFRTFMDRDNADAFRPFLVGFRAGEMRDQLPGQILIAGGVEHRPAGETDRREGLTGRTDRHRHNGEIVRIHAFGNGDQGVRVLVEEGAGAGIEAGNDFIEAPADGVLRGITLLVHVDQELNAFDGARLVERALAVLVEEGVVSVHGGGHHDPAVEPTRSATQTISVFSVQFGHGLRSVHELRHGAWRVFDTGFGQQFLVVEHGAQIEAVRDHPGGLAVCLTAHVQCLLGQRAAIFPACDLVVQIDQPVLVDASPAVRHFNDIRNIATGYHGCQFFKGLAPGQRHDFNFRARVRSFEGVHLLLQHFRALRAGDHFHQLQGFRARCRASQKRQRANCSYQSPHGSTPLLSGLV